MKLGGGTAKVHWYDACVNQTSLPLLKWPGGKRWLAPAILPIIERHLARGGTYFEPFAGGAAVFFALRPARAVLSDVNEELIETYAAVRDHAKVVTTALRRMKVTAEEYYRIRASRPRTAVSRAARFLYLNRTAFAGMYRLNARGEFNVPFGGGQRTPAVLWSRGLLDCAAQALRSATLQVADFAEVIERASKGDVVYCDPTYTVAHNNNGFIRYNEKNFRWDDQQRLALAAGRAVSRGATVIISNAHHPSISKLYPGWQRRIIERPSTICPRPALRRTVTEYLLTPTASGQRTGQGGRK